MKGDPPRSFLRQSPIVSTFYGERRTSLCLPPHGKPVTDQSNNSIKVQLDEPMSFVALLAGVWVGSYLEEPSHSKLFEALKSPPYPITGKDSQSLHL